MWCSIGQFVTNFSSGFSNFWGSLLETLCSSHFCQIGLNSNLIALIRTCIMIFTLFIHHIIFILYLFVLTCSLPLVLCFFFLFFSLLCVLILILAPCLGKLELIGFLLLLLCLPLGVSFLRTTVVVRRLRNQTVSVRFRLSVLWFLMRLIRPLGLT